jgi:tetratricopeptide (TPR) repeat protein
MQLWQQLTSRFRPKSPADPISSQIAALIARARQATNAEDYDRAWQLLTEAEAAAAQAADLVRFDIALQKVYVRMGQRATDEALALLKQAQALAEAQTGKAPLAYVQIARGQLCEARGDFAAAEAAYENARATARAVKASAPQGRATALLGALALREENASFAAHLLREAIPLMQAANDEELLAFAYGQLGLALIVTGDPSRGLGLFNQAIETGMKHNQVVTLRALNRAAAQEFMKVGMHDKAYANYQNLLKLYPYPERTPTEFLETHIRAAYLAFGNLHIEEGLGLIAKAHALQATLADRIWFPTLQAIEGLLLSQTDQAERAVELLEEALREDKILIDDVKQDVKHALAEAYHQAMRHEDAVALLEKDDMPTDGRARASFDNTFAQQAALAYYRRFIPNQRLAILADYQEMLRTAEQSGSEAQQAVSASQISLIEAELGMGPRALRRIERALLALTNDSMFSSPALDRASQVHYHYGDLETAEGLARKALETTHEHVAPHTQIRLANYLLARGQAQEALALLQTAEATLDLAKKNHAHAKLLTIRSRAYNALGSPELAIQHAQKALAIIRKPERQPEQTADAYLALGLAQIAAGEAAVGRQSLRQALAFAQRSDHQLQIWEITLHLAAALLPYEADEAAALVASIREPLLKAEPRRLLVMLHTLESRLAAHNGDMAAARQHWATASHYQRLAQLPAENAPWLEEAPYE